MNKNSGELVDEKAIFTRQYAQWNIIKAKIRSEFGETVYRKWFSDVKLQTSTADTPTLIAPNKANQLWIRKKYSQRILQLWQLEEKLINDIIITADTENNLPNMANCPAPDSEAVKKPKTFNILKAPKLIFDKFVIGPENELAYIAARKVSEGHDVSFNPLYIHGNVGMGKTHLLNAILVDFQKNNPAANCAYLSAEKFVKEFVNAIKFKENSSFDSDFQNLDLLLIDDLHFIAGKKGSQLELQHIITSMSGNGKQVVVAATHTPSEIEGLNNHVKSRLSGGLIVEIGNLDFATRLEILRSKAEMNKNRAQIPSNVLEFVAKNINGSVRDLEGAINQLLAFSEYLRRPLTLETCQTILRDMVRSKKRHINIEDIQRQICKHFNIKLAEMISQRRNNTIVTPRQVAMYLAKHMTSRSLPEIGRKFGGRDHTTVMHAVRKIEAQIEKDSALNNEIELIRDYLQTL